MKCSGSDEDWFDKQGFQGKRHERSPETSGLLSQIHQQSPDATVFFKRNLKAFRIL